MKYKGISIFCDYDGTLVNGVNPVHPDNLEAIRYFTEHGGQFSLASGRGLADYRNMPFACNGPLILSNGAEIYDLKRNCSFRQFVMDDSAVALAACIYEKWPQLALSARATDGYHTFRVTDLIFQTDPNWKYTIENPRGIKKLQGKILMLIICGEDRDTDMVRQLLEKNYPELECSMAAPKFLHITKRNASKGGALACLKEHYYPAGERPLILAVGDNENDLEMFQHSDISFAVGNAVPQLKETASVVLKDSACPCMPQILSYIDNCILLTEKD